MDTFLKSGKNAPSFVSAFDSATDMVGAVSSFLHGNNYEGVGTSYNNEFLASAINNLPGGLKQKLYTLSGNFGATSYEELPDLDATDIDKWIYDIYPDKKYPAIAIGSSNGALVHLYAALGIPWLPQTLLVPIDKKQKMPTDEPKKTLEWGINHTETFIRNNPGWQMHHMMDPNQDRLRVSRIAYFRIKKRILGTWYRKFIEERLAPGGTLIIIDCEQKWPVKKVNEHNYFQFGGLGGVDAEDYYHGNGKISKYLLNQKADVLHWDAPEPDEMMPEAEWGFEPSLGIDIQQYAEKKNIPITKIKFDHPQDVSPLIADLYRWWYPLIDRPDDRLLVESFSVLSPGLALQKGCIPFWLFFNVDPAADRLMDYLKSRKKFHELYMMIMSHGKKSLGSTSADYWKGIMKAHAKRSDFIGTDINKYPKDLAIYARYSRQLEKKIIPNFPPYEPLTLGAFENFAKEKSQHARIERLSTKKPTTEYSFSLQEKQTIS